MRVETPARVPVLARCSGRLMLEPIITGQVLPWIQFRHFCYFTSDRIHCFVGRNRKPLLVTPTNDIHRAVSRICNDFARSYFPEKSSLTAILHVKTRDLGSDKQDPATSRASRVPHPLDSLRTHARTTHTRPGLLNEHLPPSRKDLRWQLVTQYKLRIQ